VVPLDRLGPEHDDLRSWNRVSGLLVRELNRQVLGEGYFHIQGVGGSTLHFVGESHRLHPKGMKLESTFGKGRDWPISYADLEPFYTLCEEKIGVAGPINQGARWRSESYPLPPHPLSPSAKRLATAGQRLGMIWQENSRAALSVAYDGRPPCNYCGNCSRGCPLGDKGSADVTFIRHAEATGRLTLKAACPVVKMVPGNGNIRAIEYVEGNTRHRVETPLLILAAGAVQTPRLLLANRDSKHPLGLANSSRQVGKNFMESLSWKCSAFIPGLKNSHVGLPADAICWDFNSPDAIPGVVGGCRFNSATNEIGFNGPINYASRAIEGFGQELKDRVRMQFGSILSVGAIGEFLPNERSYIDLDPDKKDRFWMPFARIHSHLGESEIKRLRFMAALCRRLIKEAGGELVEEIGTYDHFSAAHVFGTCCMGSDPKTSVVDSNCRSHDHANLFITDASVFPSSGGGEAPSLTIHALAVRAADAAVMDRQGTKLPA
jgi:choline dehydrogenase-like flavoprotein